MENNNINEEELTRIENIKKVVVLFLSTKATNEELAEKTGISSSTVGRYLRNEEYILKAFPNNGKEILKKIQELLPGNSARGKIVGSEIAKVSFIRNIGTEDYDSFNNKKFYLEVFSADRDYQNKLLLHIALTFRLNLDSLELLFHRDKNELYELLIKESNGTYMFYSLEYLFKTDSSNQKKAIRDFIDFYCDFLEALKKNDKNEKIAIIRRVTDYSVKGIDKKTSNYEDITEEDIANLLNYQLKYALTSKIVSDTFNVSKSGYPKRVLKYIEDKPELKERYKNLSEYHSQNRRVQMYGRKY